MGAGRNLEQTSSLYIGIMLMFFVFISKLVESGFHRAKHWLQHHHEISLVAVLEHIKDEIMLVGTLSMMLLTIESSIAGWCVPLADQYTPANSQKKCESVYTSSTSSSGAGSNATSSASSSGRRLDISSHHRPSSTRTLLGASASAGPICPDGQTPFMDINAIHQVHFLIFWLAVCHIIYSICIVMTSRYWAQTLAKWEKKILKDGSIMGGKHKTKPPTIPSNICGEYVDAFKKQFTHFHLKGMDEFTAGVLRQFYIISQGKDADYKFFTIVKEELEQDFDEICGIDSLLWLFTAVSLFTDGLGSDSAADGIPMAATLFCIVLSLVIGTNLVVIIERLIREVYKRMVEHQIESPITMHQSLTDKKSAATVENGTVGNKVKRKSSVGIRNIFQKPYPIKADMGLMGHGKTVWLWCIKFCMFEFSRKITYVIFYYQQFQGPDGTPGYSCYHYSRTPASTYTALFCCIIFNFYIGFKLIPLYSIATHVAMHQRKVSYMHKLAKGMHKIQHLKPFLDGVSVSGIAKESQSKYVVPVAVSQNTTASNEESSAHGENIVLPVSPEEVKS